MANQTQIDLLLSSIDDKIEKLLDELEGNKSFIKCGLPSDLATPVTTYGEECGFQRALTPRQTQRSAKATVNATAYRGNANATVTANSYPSASPYPTRSRMPQNMNRQVAPAIYSKRNYKLTTTGATYDEEYGTRRSLAPSRTKTMNQLVNLASYPAQINKLLGGDNPDGDKSVINSPEQKLPPLLPPSPLPPPHPPPPPHEEQRKNQQPSTPPPPLPPSSPSSTSPKTINQQVNPASYPAQINKLLGGNKQEGDKSINNSAKQKLPFLLPLSAPPPPPQTLSPPSTSPPQLPTGKWVWAPPGKWVWVTAGQKPPPLLPLPPPSPYPPQPYEEQMRYQQPSPPPSTGQWVWGPFGEQEWVPAGQKPPSLLPFPPPSSYPPPPTYEEQIQNQNPPPQTYPPQPYQEQMRNQQPSPPTYLPQWVWGPSGEQEWVPAGQKPPSLLPFPLPSPYPPPPTYEEQIQNQKPTPPPYPPQPYQEQMRNQPPSPPPYPPQWVWGPSRDLEWAPAGQQYPPLPPPPLSYLGYKIQESANATAYPSASPYPTRSQLPQNMNRLAAPDFTSNSPPKLSRASSVDLHPAMQKAYQNVFKVLKYIDICIDNILGKQN